MYQFDIEAHVHHVGGAGFVIVFIVLFSMPFCDDSLGRERDSSVSQECIAAFWSSLH